MRQALGRFINNERLINNNSDDDVESAYKRIKVVLCNESDSTEFVDNPDATLSAMNSNDTPILKRGFLCTLWRAGWQGLSFVIASALC